LNDVSTPFEPCSNHPNPNPYPKAKIDQGFLPGISMCLQHLHEQYKLNGATCFIQEASPPVETIYTTPEELHCGVLYNVLVTAL